MILPSVHLVILFRLSLRHNVHIHTHRAHDFPWCWEQGSECVTTWRQSQKELIKTGVFNPLWEAFLWLLRGVSHPLYEKWELTWDLVSRSSFLSAKLWKLSNLSCYYQTLHILFSWLYKKERNPDSLITSSPFLPSLVQARLCFWHGTNTIWQICATWSATIPPTCSRSTSRNRMAVMYGSSWWAAASLAQCYAAPLMVACRATAPWVGRPKRVEDETLNFTLSHT